MIELVEMKGSGYGRNTEKEDEHIIFVYNIFYIFAFCVYTFYGDNKNK